MQPRERAQDIDEQSPTSITRRRFLQDIPIAAAIAGVCGCSKSSDAGKEKPLYGAFARAEAHSWAKENISTMITIEKIEEWQQTDPFIFWEHVRNLSRERLTTAVPQLQKRSDNILEEAFEDFCVDYGHRQRHGDDALTKEQIARLMGSWLRQTIARHLGIIVNGEKELQ